MTASSALGNFTLQAESYARARPGYPLELLERLLEHTQTMPGSAVTEIGAGTGLFTALLSGRGFRITALEPNEAMRAKASPLPDVQWVPGRFEETGLGAGSQAWVVAAQAFHWADAARALPEIRRILQPGKSFTVLWNNRQTAESPILTWTEAAIQRHVPEHHPDFRVKDYGSILTSTGDFTEVSYHEARHLVSMNREQYLDLWHSQNRLAVTAGPRRLAALLQDMAEHLNDQASSTFVIPYLCRAWTARSSEGT